ncbi:MAG: hypothetical protein QOJ76_61 [Acidobacteriota bacterium]|jgi:hypothetical protein|nr:hypothetical protein [Acidobacteriota bacterium]
MSERLKEPKQKKSKDEPQEENLTGGTTPTPQDEESRAKPAQSEDLEALRERLQKKFH